ncbi:MAG TPA: co-chaperone DjlA [Alphaproteobacteria bacterium]|nr:co-chaperone DjlA [Alphaproteobacteria bacterium]
MSIWGKIIGGVAGFAIGGPIGAMLGAAAGHAVDRSRSASTAGLGREDRQVAFTVAVIVLAAKMAKADGQVTSDEVAAFKEVFQIPAEERATVGNIFDEARKEASGFEPYARQVAEMFAGNREVLEELLGGLFHIAKADGVIHPAEIAYLGKVAEIFGFDEQGFERVRTSFLGAAGTGGLEDAYEILGIAPGASDGEVKSAYRKLLLDYHPDKLMAHGLPQEFIDLANKKMAAINASYDRITKQRGIK